MELTRPVLKFSAFIDHNLDNLLNPGECSTEVELVTFIVPSDGLPASEAIQAGRDPDTPSRKQGPLLYTGLHTVNASANVS